MNESPDYHETVIECWLPDITRIAWKFTGRNGAELDDLIQEGMISVWKSLEAGRNPSKTAIKNRMIDWTRFLNQRNKKQINEVRWRLQRLENQADRAAP